MDPIVERTGQVRVLQLGDGENRLNLGGVTALERSLAELADEGGPVVIGGSGKFFCNGLDLDWLGSASSVDIDSFFAGLNRVLARLLSFPGVVVAALNGHTFGAGAVLASAADLRIQREDRGYFCFPEVDLGMSLSAEFDAVVRSTFPVGIVHRALLSGHRYGGLEAREVGFVDATAPATELMPAAVELAGRYADKQPNTVADIKRRQHAAALDILPPIA